MTGLPPAQVPASAGFAQIPTFLRLPHTRDLEGLDVAILGIPYDSGVVYRPGPRFAPREIRAISGLIRRYHPVLQISPFDILRAADVGDVDTNPYSVDATFDRVEKSVAEILNAGAAPVCVGGDHSLSLPILRSVARRHGPVGMVHVDSHQDMWDQSFGNRYFHGAPFRRAVEEGLLSTNRVIQIGIRGSVRADEDFDFARQHGVRVVRAEEVARGGIDVALAQLDAVCGGPVYLSFDIDGVDPAFAPGTGTPEVGGLSSREALEIVRALAGFPIVGADVVEVSPPYDHGNITALLAANLLFEIVSVLAVTRQGRKD